MILTVGDCLSGGWIAVLLAAEAIFKCLAMEIHEVDHLLASFQTSKPPYLAGGGALQNLIAQWMAGRLPLPQSTALPSPVDCSSSSSSFHSLPPSSSLPLSYKLALLSALRSASRPPPSAVKSHVVHVNGSSSSRKEPAPNPRRRGQEERR